MQAQAALRFGAHLPKRMRISVPPATAVFRATPLQIAPEGIVLTVKNERLVSQINDTNKKQMIIEAGNIMFNQDSTSVIVRLAQSGDKVIQPTSVPVQQSAQTSTQETQPTPKPTQEIKPEIKTTQETQRIEEPLSKEKVERLESDQEKMVLELFDGKYVE